jgi:hypothetical protein
MPTPVRLQRVHAAVEDTADQGTLKPSNAPGAHAELCLRWNMAGLCSTLFHPPKPGYSSADA